MTELIIDINSNMYYQTGNMRDINNDQSPIKNSATWEKQNEFEYAQRSKYEKSEVSYIHNQKSRVIYQQEKPQRTNRTNENNQVSVTLPIRIKSTDKEDITTNFKIQLLNATDKNNRCITMHITNELDSLFLWSFFVRESQFLNLKNQQSLKVDFHGFPEVIIEHLNYCSNYEKESKNPIFYAVLDIKKGNEEAELKIIQANKYKQSLHLSLKFKKANDEQQKIYLANKYDQLRRQNSRLNDQLLSTQHKLNTRLQEVQKVSAEFQQMQREKNERIAELERRERQKIKQTTLRLEEESIRKQKAETQKSTRQYNDLSNKIQELKLKNQQLFTNYQKANEKIINLEASQSTLKSKCSTLEQQRQESQRSSKQLKLRESKNNEQLHLLKNQNTKLSYMIQSLQDKIKQKDQRLNQNSQVKSNNYNQISTLEESLRQEKQKVVKLQQKNQNLEAQISKMQKKAQDLFSKYQKKKDKLNDYKEIITMQEQKISTYEKEQRKMLEQIVQFRRQIQKSEMQIKDREIKIKDLKSHIEQNQQHMEDQKKIISELNKRLNQKSIGVKSLSIPSSLPMYTGMSTTGPISRDFSSTISSTSQSRIKYSPSPIGTNTILDKPSERIAPPFRKYRQGIENDKDQQNSRQSHSRSPIVNKLSQQMDPEEMDRTKQKIGPIKFKRQL